MLYEMGIPVVETGDRYHVDVQQKVPLNMDRDNVTPAYLRLLRAAVLNATHHLLDKEDALQPWVREACSDDRVSVEAVKSVMDMRFGSNAVRLISPIPRPTKCLWPRVVQWSMAAHCSAAEWENVRRAGVLPAAGTVTPSPKP